MPVPHLRFLNATAGVPRKPVPLRYAILVTDIDLGAMCGLLSGELHYSGADEVVTKPLLTAYELIDRPGARRVSAATIQDIYSQISPKSSLKTQLKHIPKSFYVWSNDLADAFQHYIVLVPGRENANRWGLRLDWNPALANRKQLIEECPDASHSDTRRSQQVAAVEKRNRAIIEEYKRLKKQFPHLSKSDISARISKSGKFERTSRRMRQNLAPEAVRRVINRFI